MGNVHWGKVLRTDYSHSEANLGTLENKLVFADADTRHVECGQTAAYTNLF